MSIEEFRFKVEPRESLVSREERWDAELLKLQSRGLTIKGAGPDNDYPVRYAFSAAGDMTFEEWWVGNPDEPWYEVYDTQPLAGLDFEELHGRMPAAVHACAIYDLTPESCYRSEPCMTCGVRRDEHADQTNVPSPLPGSDIDEHPFAEASRV